MLTAPSKLDTKVRSGLRTTHALVATLDWLEGTQDILVLHGGTGSGKSVAAAWAFAWASARAPMSAMGQRRSPAWYDAPGIAAMAVWKDELWAPFDGASLVVIDDVGTEAEAVRMVAVLERLCNVSSARAILTTNLAPAVWLSTYGERMASRLRGSGRWEDCPEDDLRIGAPSTPAFPSPIELTAREIEARKARARAELEEAEEFARTAEARRLQADEALAKIRLLTAEKSAREADRGISAALRRVTEKVHAEGMHERPAWDDDDREPGDPAERDAAQ